MTNDTLLKEIFERYKTIAVVGMSKNPQKAAHYVPVYLRGQGYTLIPVNPTTDEIAGLKSYATLDEIPEAIEILNIFRPSEEALAVVEAAVARKRARGDIDVIWLQLGIHNDAARQLAEAAGIIFVQNLCMYAEHRRLYG